MTSSFTWKRCCAFPRLSKGSIGRPATYLANGAAKLLTLALGSICDQRRPYLPKGLFRRSSLRALRAA